MFASTVSGFEDTPVTKYWIYFSLAIPIFTSLAELQYIFHLSINPELIVWGQWWRLLLRQLVFVNQSEVLLSILLIYNLRIVERLLGSRKFLSFILVVFSISCLAVPALFYLLSFMPYINFNTLSTGQLSVIFALFYLEERLVPPVYWFDVSDVGTGSNLHLSDKTFLCIIAFQLALFHLSSIAEAFFGYFLGSLIHNELIPGKNWRVPFYKYLHLEPSNSPGTSDVGIPSSDGDFNGNSSLNMTSVSTETSTPRDHGETQSPN